MAAIEASPVAQALIEFMQGREEWTGTAKQLLDAITPVSIDPGSPPPRGWPVSGRGMSAVLTRFASALRRIQINIEHLPRSDAKGTRLLRLVCKVPAQPSESSDPSEARWDAGSGSDGRSGQPSETVSSTVREPGNRQRPPAQNYNEINHTDGSDGSDGTFYDGDALPEGQVEVEK
jgi:hypothetical protein